MALLKIKTCPCGFQPEHLMIKAVCENNFGSVQCDFITKEFPKYKFPFEIYCRCNMRNKGSKQK